MNRQMKRLKDPIYGYIDIPTQISKEIIDSASFQRLRRIIQTSYSPLYASSIHNRFVHSLGVYFLGKIAADTLEQKIKEQEIELVNVENVKEIFLLACLLHDVGHAPFSHTGEKYYLDDTEGKKYVSIHEHLNKVVDSPIFAGDVPCEDSNSAAPHEIMSAIVAITAFPSFFKTQFDREFFSRCITGYKYSTNTQESSLYNCFISLLNGKVIDVDRLDYLIRDAFFTGFETVSVDYERLLTSLTVVESPDLTGEEDEPLYELAYYKNAISVIENVVYAHDSERKWIQTHPIVLYEIYIIQHIINELNSTFQEKDQKLFSFETLSLEGKEFEDNLKISLMCDDDLIYLLKNKLNDPLSQEYFSRNLRRSPIWKSEAEYKANLKQEVAPRILNDLEKALKETEKYVQKNSATWIIDQTLFDALEKEIKNIHEDKSITNPNTKKNMLKTKESIKKIFCGLRQYAEEKGEEFDYVLLSASQFYSGFNKTDVRKINILFQSQPQDIIQKFEDVVSLLNGEEKWRDEFFYVFHKSKPEQGIFIKELFSCLTSQFL